MKAPNHSKPLKAVSAQKTASWLANSIKIISASLMCLSLPIKAHAAEKQEMIYEVYAGGIHAVQAHLTLDTSKPDHYALKLTAKTRGFLGKLAPWQGSFESYGWRDGDQLQPKLHRSIATWRGEEEVKSYHYNRDGSFQSLTIKDFDKPKRTAKVEHALTDQTTDALTATLETLLRIAQGQDCTHSTDVFDGKRRFAQKFVQQKTETLHPSRYNIFEGYSHVCTVEIEPKGGAWHKKPRGWMSIQEQGRDKGTMPTVWMGQIKPDLPAVPIKILVKTDYGALFMHLAQHQSHDDLRVADKRAQRDAK